MIQKIKSFIISHKIVSIIILIIILTGIYLLIKNNKNTETSYIIEKVEIGNIETIVSGTGQIEASNTITLKSKTTGDITSVKVAAGQEVRKGQLIASVDSRDAKIALENAQIALEKLTSPNSLSVIQDKNSLTKSYSDGWNTVASFITDTPSQIEEINAIYANDGFLGNSNTLNMESSIRSKVRAGEDSFYKAKKSFENVVKIYKGLSISSSNEDIKKLINETYNSAKLMALAVKNTEEAFNYLVDSLNDQSDSVITSNRTNISSWMSDSNSNVNNLLGDINAINESDALFSDKGEVRSAELSLQAKQDAYNDCFITAPFDGIIATLTAKVGESSGSSIGTLITKQKVVTVPFNEVDIASIKLGQKAQLLFDAIPDLNINGIVSEIDSVGTVSSGVVTYNVKISLLENDERVKGGMSVSAEIITNYKEGILVVSNNSIKTKNGKSYVEILGDDNKVTKKNVEIGISNDTKTEIVSGLAEGESIISKTIAGTSSKTTAPSILNTMSAGAKTGAGTGAGAGMRIPHD